MVEPVSGGPLAGVRVVDLTNNLSGPFGTQILAQQGADVIKVERPPRGDILRGVGSTRGGVAAYFVNTNWGKRSIALDLREERDRRVLARLIARADVLVENFRPSVMPGFGFVPAEVCAEHERLVYAAIRGFPATSTLADAPAYDHVIQAMTGFASCQADLKEGTPELVHQALVDKTTGLTAAQAITAALFERERTGRGQLLEISMLQVGLSFLWPDAATNASFVGTVDKLPPQSRTFRLTKTADGHVALITVANDQFDGLLRATGREHLIGDPKLNSPQQRGRHGAQVMREVAAFLREKPTTEVIALLTANGVPCGAVTDLDDVAAAMDEIAPGAMVRETHPQLGEMVHPAPAVRFDEPVHVRPAPAFGEHTDEVLAELDAPHPFRRQKPGQVTGL
jgi:crotonobetainyl-CoA:carnitine CoA-transferase CaiB-like acyl-CoA transferase